MCNVTSETEIVSGIPAENVIDVDNTRKRKDDHKMSDSLIKDEEWDSNADLIVCPKCGFDYSHIGDIKIHNSDNYNAWAGRGECIIIPVSGECGHEWEICIGYHKGKNHIFIDTHGNGQRR